MTAKLKSHYIRLQKKQAKAYYIAKSLNSIHQYLIFNETLDKIKRNNRIQ